MSRRLVIHAGGVDKSQTIIYCNHPPNMEIRRPSPAFSINSPSPRGEPLRAVWFSTLGHNLAVI